MIRPAKDSMKSLLKSYCRLRNVKRVAAQIDRDFHIVNRVGAWFFSAGFIVWSALRVISLLKGEILDGFLIAGHLWLGLVLLLGAIGFFREVWKHRLMHTTPPFTNDLNNRIDGALEEIEAIIGKDSIKEIDKLLDAPDREKCSQALQFRKRFGPLLIVLLVGFIGILLEVSIGKHFVFSATDQYFKAAFWAFVPLTAVWAWFWFRAEQVSRSMARDRRGPSPWFQKLIMFSALIFLPAAVTVIGPLGWFALYGRLAGTHVTEMPATIMHLEAPSPHFPWVNPRLCRGTLKV